MRLNEKGFSIIELAVLIPVVALITLAVSMTVFQIIQATRLNIDWTTSVRQAQNVGDWISRDIMSAHTANASDDPGTTDIELVFMSKKDWVTGEFVNIRYIWSDSAGSLKKLKRLQLTEDKDGVQTGDKSTLIAGNIYSANLSSQSGIWVLNVEARSGERTTTREFAIDQRN